MFLIGQTFDTLRALIGQWVDHVMSGGGGNETRVYQLFYWDDDMRLKE